MTQFDKEFEQGYDAFVADQPYDNNQSKAWTDGFLAAACDAAEDANCA